MSADLFEASVVAESQSEEDAKEEVAAKTPDQEHCDEADSESDEHTKLGEEFSGMNNRVAALALPPVLTSQQRCLYLADVFDVLTLLGKTHWWKISCCRANLDLRDGPLLSLPRHLFIQQSHPRNRPTHIVVDGRAGQRCGAQCKAHRVINFLRPGAGMQPCTLRCGRIRDHRGKCICPAHNAHLLTFLARVAVHSQEASENYRVIIQHCFRIWREQR